MKRALLVILLLIAAPVWALDNCWIAVSTAAQRTIREGTTDVQRRALEVLKRSHDQGAVSGLWRKPVVGGRTYHVHSIYIERAALANRIDTALGVHAVNLGCWDFATGAITSPLSNRLIDVLPDIVTYDEEGNELTRTRPAQLGAQINLLQGQAPRQWQ